MLLHDIGTSKAHCNVFQVAFFQILKYCVQILQALSLLVLARDIIDGLVLQSPNK